MVNKTIAPTLSDEVLELVFGQKEADGLQTGYFYNRRGQKLFKRYKEVSNDCHGKYLNSS